jgi:hypothetical protein
MFKNNTLLNPPTPKHETYANQMQEFYGENHEILII